MGERTVRIALALSVAFNLFVLGAAGGGAFVWSRHGPEPPAVRRRPLLAAADTLPAADRDRFLATMREAIRDAQPLQREGRAERRLAVALFTQPAFDLPAVSSALAKARDADFALRGRLEATVVDFATNLPQSERVILAKGLARRGPLRQPQPRGGSGSPVSAPGGH